MQPVPERLVPGGPRQARAAREAAALPPPTPIGGLSCRPAETVIARGRPGPDRQRGEGIARAAGLVSPITSRSYHRRPGSGAHARRPAMARAGRARHAWRELRTYLLLTATGAVWLVTGPKRNAAAQVLTAVIVIAIVLWELGSWLKASRGRPGAAWQEIPRILLPAMPSLAYLASGWSYTK